MLFKCMHVFIFVFTLFLTSFATSTQQAQAQKAREEALRVASELVAQSHIKAEHRKAQMHESIKETERNREDAVCERGR